ncbi:MAG: ABC transporter permease [Rhodospirillales bacterium]
MDALTGWWDDYFWGATVIARVFAVSMGLMILFGLIGAWAKLSRFTALQKAAGLYTVVFRGTPEILVILLLYYGSAMTLTAAAQVFDPEIKFLDIPPFWAGALAISLVVGAYATETFRGAFMGVQPGSVEAARALGLSDFQTFVYVRIPEMWRIALPSLGNHALSLVKDTALISIIGLNETLFVAKQATSTTGKPFTMFIMVGVIYLAFSTVITLSFMTMEYFANRHLRKSG